MTPSIVTRGVAYKLEPQRRYALRPPHEAELSDVVKARGVLAQAKESGADLLIPPGWLLVDVTDGEIVIEEPKP